jgi:hypothetical protein
MECIVKKQDLVFVACLALFLSPFLVCSAVQEFYLTTVRDHALLTSFVKFAVLATLGEIIGLRISRGVYHQAGFGVLPRALVWGFLGVGIKIAFVIFAVGAPAFVGKYIVALPPDILAQPFSGVKLLTVFTISVTLNLIFAPVFMTLHRITDTHIIATGGTLRGFFSPIDCGRILQNIDWPVMWGFVFKKTLPLFWIPAHTITFLLPPQHRILFAAFLGVVLGVILAFASLAKSRQPEAA